ncbi:NAD(P)-binding protein [Parvibaculum sedimenti]|uniref:NAD(P)-binding protein n=1 Tax=Parvibaculum sedimenti TaxID=2608632 RepID=A0A6N6VMV6_9HYPH|nr:NAD(P)-dependent oxidoreductase [Parvibaculum sedimenti]KAB7741705.1 NAD(P)-binding protein [Parvibaculum sedimenti]
MGTSNLTKDSPDISAGRLDLSEYAINFDDAVPPLNPQTARVEANRCYFCYNAPCMTACPTGIDIPGFIKKIATDNLTGAAVRILEQNILGGSCARDCPTEILCEQACVRNAEGESPITIGSLQRYAMDNGLDGMPHPFTRAETTGKRVAVVGGGPAGLACAHRLAMLGHEVTIFEAREKLGGLNEYGVAEYKLANDFAAREVAFIMEIGGIEVKLGTALGRDVTLAGLRAEYDAIFLGLGLGAVKALDCEGETLEGVYNAVDYIASIRQAEDFALLPIGRRIVVIGGGNTAIDIAVQAKRLGAEDVTLVYRRDAEAMSATDHEQEFAQTNGVTIKYWSRPLRIEGVNDHVTKVVFEHTGLDTNGKLVGTGREFVIEADMVFKAIGQSFVADPLKDSEQSLLELSQGRIKADDEGRTSLGGVWAGGDCVAGGQDLTVESVQAGKIAAHSIDRVLRK